MKKYIKPIANVVKLDTECLLTNSDVNVLSPGNGSDALGRGHRRGRNLDWDDDDEE